ncbi:MAG TPA: condensation domain-containing protein, partial [Methanocorpusculum sp.]|nr:condensation domain-containing protein [Methanocorpusculum sp.]
SPAGGKYLAAYVVSDNPVDIKALNAFIAAEKPPYMVPAVTIQLDVLPHNQNMKVNRKALPVPELTAADAVPPQNELQQKLYDIVANVLGHSGFGINTNFTDAGLTSISSVQLMVHLSREFNVSVKLGAILEHNTIEKLAEYLLTADADVRYEILPDYPLTPIQYSTFVECVANPGTPIYNIPFLLHLGNTTDIAKIETAVKAAVNAHPYLKMVLSVNSNGEIRAKRNDDAEVNFRIIRTHSLPDSKTLVRPYDLMQFNTPLYRIELYQTDDGNYLFMDFSHIYFDGESLEILEKDLIRAYSGESLERETYTGYEAALDEQKRLISKEFIDAQQYSENLMKTSGPVATIPFNSDTNDGKILNAIRFCNLDTDSVKAYCSQNALTLNSFFNAALSIVLSKYTALKKGLYATLYNGRNDVKLMNSVALLVKMLLIPYSLNLTASFTAYAHTIQDIILNDIKYDIYPFAKVLQDYKIDVRKSIYLTYQPEMSLTVPFDNDPAEVILMEEEGMKCSISANVALVDGVFVFFFTYSTAQYTSELMDTFLEDLETTCSEGILNPVLSEMSVLSGVSFAEDTLLITHETTAENREDADVSNAIQGEIVPPQNELQQMIFEIAAELLGHRTFGITTSLYSVGLESFTAVTLIVLLGQKFNVYLQFSEMHEYDTIEKIAAYIAAVNVK